MKRRLHTTISEEASRIIEKYIPEYGRVNNIIEEALVVFDRHKRGDGRECSLADIMNEANLVAFNAKTIELVVSGEIEKALCDNELEILIRKLYNKPISKISLSEAVEGVRNCLLTTRKATRVSVKRDDVGYYLLVTSNLGQNTDLIICEALRRFFEMNYNARVIFEVFPQGYSIYVREDDSKLEVADKAEVKATPKL